MLNCIPMTKLQLVTWSENKNPRNRNVSKHFCFFFSFPRQNIVKCRKALKRGIFEIWRMSDRWARGQLCVYVLNFLSRLKDRKDLF